MTDVAQRGAGGHGGGAGEKGVQEEEIKWIPS